jgi:hypothetical protein
VKVDIITGKIVGWDSLFALIDQPYLKPPINEDDVVNRIRPGEYTVVQLNEFEFEMSNHKNGTKIIVYLRI